MQFLFYVLSTYSINLNYTWNLKALKKTPSHLKLKFWWYILGKRMRGRDDQNRKQDFVPKYPGHKSEFCTKISKKKNRHVHWTTDKRKFKKAEVRFIRGNESRVFRYNIKILNFYTSRFNKKNYSLPFKIISKLRHSSRHISTYRCCLFFQISL